MAITWFALSTAAAAVDQEVCNTPQSPNNSPVGALGEYERMYIETDQVTKFDLSLFTISSSSIHGRGVHLTRPVAKDRAIGIIWYEVEQDIDQTPSLEGYRHARGYITDGGKIDKQMMPVREALQKCNDLPECQGITFQDPQHLFVDPHNLPDTTVDVEFKDKVHFSQDPENSWQSFLSHRENLAAIYVPLGCGGQFLPTPPPSFLDPQLMLPCWPRYVNHSCSPNTKLIMVPVDEGFVLPGVPWKRVVGAYQVVPLRDLEEGDEISLNYEDFPTYMMRRVDGVDECDKLEDS